MHPRKCANARRAAGRKLPTQPPKVPVQRRAGCGWPVRKKRETRVFFPAARAEKNPSYTAVDYGSTLNLGISGSILTEPEMPSLCRRRVAVSPRGTEPRSSEPATLAGWRAGRKSPIHPPKVQIHRRAASRKCKYIGGQEGGENYLSCL